MTHGATAPAPRRNRGQGGRVLLLSSALFLLGACSTRTDVTYTVRAGDTLAEIARSYGVAHQEIARSNRLRDPDRIYPGQVLQIPGGRTQRRQAVSAPRPAPARTAGSGAVLETQLAWPVPGGVLGSRFGPRGDKFHDGIDIRAPVGTPVQAAERGVVVFSGVLRGYGNIVVVRHPSGAATVYAHNQSNWVQRGQAVRRGEVIATVGRTGRTTGPNLHFEVWHAGRVIDPLSVLDADAAAVAGHAPPADSASP